MPFHGAHQAGIATAVQDRLHFAAFDVTTDDRAELVAAAQGVDDAAARRMTAGHAVGEGASAVSPRRRRTTPARRWACSRPG